MADNKTAKRKLKLQVQMSVDGYIAGPNGEMDWLVWNWDDKLKGYVNELTESVDTILHLYFSCISLFHSFFFTFPFLFQYFCCFRNPALD
jgi:hypothetical protein